MKQTIGIVLAIAFLLTSGMTCKNQTDRQTAYKTLATVGLSVDTASNAFVAAYHAGEVSEKDWLKMTELHREWLLAYNEACALAAYDFSKYSPPDLIAIELRVINTINEILNNKN